MQIDAHQHFWIYEPLRDSWITPNMQAIAKDFLPDDLQPFLKENNFEGCVAIQAHQSETETHFLLSLATNYSFIKGVVGWVNILGDDLEERLEYFSSFKKLKGFRHIVQAEPKGFLTQPKFIRGVRKLAALGFTYDLLIYHHQLEDALIFVHELPDVHIVIDHLAKPSIKTGEKTHWELQMAALSTFQNVYCKISGMVTEANWQNWKQDDFTPYLDELFESFGANRLMYGSDWPVCLLAASYHQQLSIVASYLSKISATEKALVLGENARRFYNL